VVRDVSGIKLVGAGMGGNPQRGGGHRGEWEAKEGKERVSMGGSQGVGVERKGGTGGWVIEAPGTSPEVDWKSTMDGDEVKRLEGGRLRGRSLR